MNERRARVAVLLSGSGRTLENFLEKIAAAKAGGAPSLAEDLEYKLIASKIRRQSGGTAPAMVTFNRPEMAMRMVYDLINSDETRRRLSERAADNDFFSGIDKAMTHLMAAVGRFSTTTAPGQPTTM